MLRILIVMTMIFVANAHVSSSQSVDPKSLSNSFSKIPGTPRIAANEAEKEWLVVWRQNTPGKIMGRIIQADGTPGPRKTLLKGIHSSSDSLDVAFDPVNSRYLLTFETKRGLEVQLFDQGLRKQSSSILIESGVQESLVRVVFDPKANHFLLFWLKNQGGAARILKVLLLDTSANAIGNSQTLVEAGPANHFGALSVAKNQKKGSFIVMLLEVAPNLENSVIGYMVKPDGTLLSTKASVFQGFTSAPNTIPQASFADSGKGLALWSNANQVKARKVSEKGKAGSATTTITTAAVPIGSQPAIAFDSKNGELVALWAERKQIKGARLNANTGAAIEQLEVATSLLDNTLDVALSYNEGAGNFLAVWEDASLDPNANPTAFRIRGGVLGGAQENVISTTEQFTFTPAAITIHAGETVTWVNAASNSVHTVTSGDPSNAGTLFDQILGRKKSFKFKFTRTGSFPYFCRVHGQSMKGVVTVVP